MADTRYYSQSRTQNKPLINCFGSVISWSPFVEVCRLDKLAPVVKVDIPQCGHLTGLIHNNRYSIIYLNDNTANFCHMLEYNMQSEKNVI